MYYFISTSWSRGAEWNSSPRPGVFLKFVYIHRWIATFFFLLPVPATFCYRISLSCFIINHSFVVNNILSYNLVRHGILSYIVSLLVAMILSSKLWHWFIPEISSFLPKNSTLFSLRKLHSRTQPLCHVAPGSPAFHYRLGLVRTSSLWNNSHGKLAYVWLYSLKGFLYSDKKWRTSFYGFILWLDCGMLCFLL